MPFIPDDAPITPKGFIPDEPVVQKTGFIPDAPDADILTNMPKEDTGNVPWELVKGFARGVEALPEAVGTLTQVSGELTGIKTIEKAGKNLADFFARNKMKGWEAPSVAATETLKEHPFIRSAAIIGEAIPQLGAAILSGGLGEAALAARLAPAAAKVGGSVIGAGTLGFGMATPATYLEAREKGAGKGKALGAGLAVGAGETFLEFFPMNFIFRGAGGPIWKQTLKGTFGEGSEEVIQQAWDNIVAKVGYDKTREVTSGMMESFIGGAGAGAVGGAVTARANVRADKKLTETLTKAGVPKEQVELVKSQLQSLVTEHASEMIVLPGLARDMKGNLSVDEETGKFVVPTAIADTDFAKTVGQVKNAKGVMEAFGTLGTREMRLPRVLDVMQQKKVKLTNLPIELQGEVLKKISTMVDDGLISPEGKILKPKAVINGIQNTFFQHLPSTIYYNAGDILSPVSYYNNMYKVPELLDELERQGLISADEKGKVTLSPQLKFRSSGKEITPEYLKNYLIKEYGRKTAKRSIQPITSETMDKAAATMSAAEDTIQAERQRLFDEAVAVIKKEIPKRDNAIKDTKSYIAKKIEVMKDLARRMPFVEIVLIDGGLVEGDFHVGITDRKGKRVRIKPQAVVEAWAKYSRGESLLSEELISKGIIDYPKGLTLPEFRKMVENHEKIHLLFGVDGGAMSENLATVLALEYMGKSVLAAAIEKQMGLSQTLTKTDEGIEDQFPMEVREAIAKEELAALGGLTLAQIDDIIKTGSTSSIFATKEKRQAIQGIINKYGLRPTRTIVARHKVTDWDKVVAGKETAPMIPRPMTDAEYRDYKDSLRYSINNNLTLTDAQKTNPNYNRAISEISAEYVLPKPEVIQEEQKMVKVEIKETKNISLQRLIQRDERQMVFALTNIWLVNEGLKTFNSLAEGLAFISKLDQSVQQKWLNFMAAHELTETDIKDIFDRSPIIQKMSKDDYHSSNWRISLSPLAQRLVEADRQHDQDLIYTDRKKYIEWRNSQLREMHADKGKPTLDFIKNAKLYETLASNEYASLAKQEAEKRGTFILEGKTYFTSPEFARSAATVDAMYQRELKAIEEEAIKAGKTIDDLRREIEDNETAGLEPPSHLATDDGGASGAMLSTKMRDIANESKAIRDAGGDPVEEMDDELPVHINDRAPVLDAEKLGIKAKTWLRFMKLFGKTQYDYEDYIGEDAVKKELERQDVLKIYSGVSKQSLYDTIKQAVSLRGSDNAAQFYRSRTMVVIQNRINEVAKARGIYKTTDISERHRYLRAVGRVLGLASAETIWDTDMSKFTRSYAGQNRDFASVREEQAFKQVMKETVGALREWFPNLPTDANIDALTKKPGLAFFNMLDIPEYKTLIGWWKTSMENPFLAMLLKSGNLDESNIAQKVWDGFFHRDWELKAQQKQAGGISSEMRKRQFEAQRYRTPWEFIAESKSQELTPLVDFTTNAGNYMYDSMRMIEQSRAIEVFKAIPSNPEDPTNTNTVVVFEGDKLTGMPPKPQFFATKEEEDKWMKEWHAQATKLGYRELKAATALVRWKNGVFQSPFVMAPMADVLDHYLGTVSKDPTGGLKFLNAINSFLKRYLIMFSPFMYLPNAMSTNWLWMTKNMEWWKYGGVKGLLTLEPFRKTWSLRRVLLDNDPTEFLTKMEYDPKTMDLFLRYGIIRNPAQNIQQMFSRLSIAEQNPLLRSKAERWRQYIESKFGMDSYVFGQMVTQSQYFFAKAMVDNYMKRYNVPMEEAARAMSTFIGDAAGMPNPLIYGDLDKILNAWFFARDFTFTALRQATGAVGIHPESAGIPFQTKGWGQLLNTLFHGEVSQEDLRKLRPYYRAQIVRAGVAKLMFVTLLQQALWYLLGGDDEDPKYPWENEPGQKLRIATPKKNDRGQRIYLDAILFREFEDILQWADPLKQVTGKLAWTPKMIIEQVANKDWTGENITSFAASPLQQTADRLEYAASSVFPSGIKPGFRHEPGELGLQTLGIMVKRGIPVQPGMDVQTALGLRKASQTIRYEDEETRRLLRGLRPGDKKALDLVAQGKLSAKSYINWVESYYFPQAKQLRSTETLMEFFKQ